MSAREWKPGDVALWTASDGETHRLFREGYGERGDNRARWFGATCGEAWPEPFDDLRPLIVIDAEDAEAVAELRRQLITLGILPTDRLEDWQAALREFANPRVKPNEPTGLGAVVLDGGTRWTLAVRIPGSFPWVGEHGGVRGWSEFSDAAEVLSEGVTP